MSAKQTVTVAKEQVRRAGAHLPPGVRRRAMGFISRSKGVQDREILGRHLRVEGANHGDVDYDDAWLIGLISESDAFLDIGCNVGYFSLASCILRPTARVLAIDANPECAAVTAANLVRNGFGDRSQAVSAFVSDAPGDVQFNTVGLGAAGSAVTGLAESAEYADAAMVVRSDTLDAILQHSRFEPDLIKVDVEGAEREVLAGATQTVADHAPRFMIEMHSGPTLDMVENTADVLAWCEGHGYAAWYLSKGVRLDDAGQVAGRGRCHLLLQPKDAAFPEIIEGIAQSSSLDAVLTRISAAQPGA